MKIPRYTFWWCSYPSSILWVSNCSIHWCGPGALAKLRNHTLRSLHLNCSGDLTLGDLGSKFSNNVRKCWGNSYTKFGAAARRRFSAIAEKPQGAHMCPPAVRGLRICGSRRWSHEHVWMSVGNTYPYAYHQQNKDGTLQVTGVDMLRKVIREKKTFLEWQVIRSRVISAKPGGGATPYTGGGLVSKCTHTASAFRTHCFMLKVCSRRIW